MTFWTNLEHYSSIVEERVCTVDEVGVVAAFPQLHHGVEEVGYASWSTGSCTSFGEEGEIFLQNGPVIFLLDVGQLHLTTTKTAEIISSIHFPLDPSHLVGIKRYLNNCLFFGR